jgi:spermidine synthase
MIKKIEWVRNDFGHIYQGQSLYRGKTPYQRMELFRSKTFGTMLFLDNKIQLSHGDENRYHQHLVSAPLLAHANPKSILIIGGGDAFSIEEAIKFPSLKSILMVEIDKGVVDFCKKWYPDIKKSLKDPRVEIIYADARKWMEASQSHFDVIVIDLTEPHGPSKMLYTQEFYKLCKHHLQRNGLISIHTDNYYLFPLSFSTIYKTVHSIFPFIQTARVDMPCFGMGWTYRIASSTPISITTMESRLKKFKKKNVFFNAFTPSIYRVQPTLEELNILKTMGNISTDKKPFDKFESMGKHIVHTLSKSKLKFS